MIKMKARKFRSAAEKRKVEENQKAWEALLKKYPSKHLAPETNWVYNLRPPPGRETAYIPSRGDGVGVAVKKDVQVYTGTEMIGIATMHKSNSIPVFKRSEAEEISSMRR